MGKRTRPVVGITILVVALGSLQSPAAVFTVTTDSDDGPGSLRDAINQANSLPGADEIVFDASLHGVTIELTTGQLTITDDLTIYGPGDDQLTVARSPSAPEFRILEVDDGGSGTRIQVEVIGLKLTGGHVSTPDMEGGAVWNAEDLVLRNSTISGCMVEGIGPSMPYYPFPAGGGIFSTGSLTLERCRVTDNHASMTGSGNYQEGWAAGGGVSSSGTLTISHTTLAYNSASASAFYAYAWGGAVNALDVVITNSSITGSTAHASSTYSHGGASGGGVGGREVTISSSTIAGNTALSDGFRYHSAEGGGVAGGDVLIESTTVTGNSSQGEEASGGGVESSWTLTVRNSTISGNTVVAAEEGTGGGLIATGSAAIQSSTVVLNILDASPTAGHGGGVSLAPGATLESTIVHGNSAPQAPDVSSDGFAVAADNLIGDPSGSSIVIGVNGNISGDPDLGPLADNGGPTLTHALPGDSIAVDAGSNPAGLSTDQRGYGPREVNGVADIGAFELGAQRVIFADGFESGDTTLWSVSVP